MLLLFLLQRIFCCCFQHISVGRMLFRVNPFEKMMVEVVVNQFTFMWAYTPCGEVGRGH